DGLHLGLEHDRPELRRTPLVGPRKVAVPGEQIVADPQAVPPSEPGEAAQDFLPVERPRRSHDSYKVMRCERLGKDEHLGAPSKFSYSMAVAKPGEHRTALARLGGALRNVPPLARGFFSSTTGAIDDWMTRALGEEFNSRLSRVPLTLTSTGVDP